MSVTITRDDWLRALEESGLPLADDQSALTLYEVMAMLDVNRSTAQHRVDRLVDAGRAVKTWKRCPRADGRMQQMRAYRLT